MAWAKGSLVKMQSPTLESYCSKNPQDPFCELLREENASSGLTAGGSAPNPNSIGREQGVGDVGGPRGA